MALLVKHIGKKDDQSLFLGYLKEQAHFYAPGCCDIVDEEGAKRLCTENPRSFEIVGPAPASDLSEPAWGFLGEAFAAVGAEPVAEPEEEDSLTGGEGGDSLPCAEGDDTAFAHDSFFDSLPGDKEEETLPVSSIVETATATAAKTDDPAEGEMREALAEIGVKTGNIKKLATLRKKYAEHFAGAEG